MRTFHKILGIFGIGVTALVLTAGIEFSGPPGVTDHGALTGLTDDDHTQYLKERASGGADTEVPVHAHDAAGGGQLSWNDVWIGPSGAVHPHDAVGEGGQLDHGFAMIAASLLDDDHTQYALLAGRSGGQTFIGGTGAGDDLSLRATSDPTDGDIIFQTDPTTERVRIPLTGELLVGLSAPSGEAGAGVLQTSTAQNTMASFATSLTLGRVFAVVPEVVNNAPAFTFAVSPVSSNATVISEIQGVVTQATPSTLKGDLRFFVNQGDSVIEAIRIASGEIAPPTNDATSLGVTGRAFSDLFLANGAVINFGAGNITTTHSTGRLTTTGSFHFSGNAASALGSEVPVGREKIKIGGTFASDGSGNAGVVVRINNTLTGAPLDTAVLVGLLVDNAITTQPTDVIANVTQIQVNEPQITLGGGASITTASTVRIVDAPTEGGSNYALFVDDGLSRFDGAVQLANATTTVDGAVAFDRTNEDLSIGDGTGSQIIHMGAWKTWVPTFTGFSADPTGAFRYTQIGKTVNISFDMSGGTSNATGFTMTLPITAAASGVWPGAVQGVNNGAIIITPALGLISPSATSVTFFTDWAGAGWTASGGKRADGVLTYEGI